MSAAGAGGRPLLAVEGLAVSFPSADGGARRVVAGASLAVHEGTTSALVGESGCGKSVTALAIVGLLPRGARVESGSARLREGTGAVDLLRLAPGPLRRRRGQEIAFIFQEPMTSLNPVLTIGEQIVEAVRAHRSAGRAGARRAARESLRAVGLPDARLGAYPHEFSGGMRQRVMIAMALALRPRVLIADEPTTALDVTVQGQVLDLVGAAQRERGLGVLLITHDLGLVAQRADVVYVMYAGTIVEAAQTADIFARPLHPYTRGLLACAPSLGSRRDRLRTVEEFLSDETAWEAVTTREGPAEPWWPEGAPARAPRARGGERTPGARRLAEAAPGHWLAVQGASDGTPAREEFPDPWSRAARNEPAPA